MRCFLFIFLLFIDLSISLASDSLKIKKIYYFEDSLLIRTESLDAKGRIISVFNNGFMDFDANAEPLTNYIFRDFFENSGIVKSYWTFNLKSENGKLFFQNENAGGLFQKEYDSKKKVFIDKLKWLRVSEKQLNKPVLLDSIKFYSYNFEKDFHRQKRILKYDKNDNLIYEKRVEAEQMIYESIAEFDSLSREVKKVVKIREEYSVPASDDERFQQTIQTIDLQKIEIIYDDIIHIKNTIAEVYRRNKLIKKTLLKDYYDSQKNLIKQEEYQFEIQKNVSSENPQLVSTIHNIYENNLRIKRIFHDFVSNLIRTQYLTYEFW